MAGKVKEVKLSTRLKSHPVCLASEGPISIEMERVLDTMPEPNYHKAERILELNANHPIFQTLCDVYPTDEKKAADYINILYNPGPAHRRVKYRGPSCLRQCRMQPAQQIIAKR